MLTSLGKTGFMIATLPIQIIPASNYLAHEYARENGLIPPEQK